MYTSKSIINACWARESGARKVVSSGFMIVDLDGDHGGNAIQMLRKGRGLTLLDTLFLSCRIKFYIGVHALQTEQIRVSKDLTA